MDVARSERRLGAAVGGEARRRAPGRPPRRRGSAWRGAMTSRASGPQVGHMGEGLEHDLVLAGDGCWRPAAPAGRRRRGAGRPGRGVDRRGAPASFRFRRPAGLAPRPARRSADSASCGSTRSKAVSTQRAAPAAFSSGRRWPGSCGPRPGPARAPGLGPEHQVGPQLALGEHHQVRASSGPGSAARAGASTGAYWWMTPGRQAAGQDLGRGDGAGGDQHLDIGPRSAQASISGSSDRLSPTLAPCSQASGPGRAGLRSAARRSPRRAASSLPLARGRPAAEGSAGSASAVSRR
jgi:hypothetical protein